MGTQFLNVDVGRCMINLTNKPNSTMFRFVALFALVAVALAEPEADAQWLVNPYNTVAGVPVVNHVVKPLVYNQVPVVKSVVKPIVYNQVPVVTPFVKPVVYKRIDPVVTPVVKYVDPHHTEGMTEQGVPEKTDSVKIAEKQHEVAQAIENAKAKVQYVAPYTTYGFTGVHPYVHPVGHYIAKREADSESDPYVLYNTHAGAVYPYGTTYGTPYHTTVAGFPYNTAVSGYTYQSPYVAHTSPVVYRGKRDAESDAQYYYNHYATPYAYNYGYPYTYNNAYTYGIRHVAGYHY